MDQKQFLQFNSLMNRFLIISLFIILLAGLSTSKLYQVVSVFRHGARYHLNTMYDGNSTRPMWGQLTAVGMRQHENLGKLIRKQYVDALGFLSPSYNKSQIQVYSTPVNRTIQSVMSQLYGLYPPGTGPRLTYVQRSYHLPPYSNKTDIDEQNYALPNAHQPIPVKFNGKLLLQNCKNMGQLISRNYDIKKAEFQSMLLDYKPFLEQIADTFNITDKESFSNNFSAFSRLFDTLSVDKWLGRPLPANLSEDDFKNMQHIMYWRIFFEFSSNVSTISNARKFQKVLDVFDARTRDINGYPLKWSFLSAHDTHIAPLQVGLNISSSVCIEQLWKTGSTNALNCEVGPEYASSVIFELHSDNAKDFYVKIRFNGKYVNLCQKKDVKCSYTDFRNRISKLIISDAQIERQCGNKIPEIPSGQKGYSDFYDMDLEDLQLFNKQFDKTQLLDKQQSIEKEIVTE